MRAQSQGHRGAWTAVAAGVLLLALAVLALARPTLTAAQTGGCASTIDLMLALDGSESISPADFTLMRGFAGDLIGHFTISPDDAHAGIVQFAGQGQGRVEAGLSDAPDTVQGAAAGMTQIVGGTDLQEGIALAQGELTDAGRPDVSHVLIVLTDGVHNQPGDPVAEAEAARAAGTEVFAIAVGPGPDLEQLIGITGATERVFSVSDFDALVSILDPLVQTVCPPTPTPAPEVLAPEPEPGEGDVGPPVLGVRGLPATGHHDVPDRWTHRGLWLLMQALAGVTATGALLAGTYWVGRRRGR